MPARTTSKTSGPQRVVLPLPHPGQRVVLDALARGTRFVFLDAGRRWFKTTLDLNIAVTSALAGKEVMWGAPTYDQVRIGWEELRRAAGAVATLNQTYLEAKFPTGGIVRFRSLDDPDNARGFTADVWLVDEAGDVHEQAWYEAIRAQLMSTDGIAVINGTPKGRNWFWREFMRAQAGDMEGGAAWQVPTVGARIETDPRDGHRTLVRVPHPMENPHIPWSEIEEMFQQLPERTFRQEILAEFLEDAGGLFHGVRAAITRAVALDKPRSTSDRFVIGCDLAKHEDWTVLCVADERTREQVAFYRWQHADWPLTKARIIELARLWNNAVVWADATGAGDPIYDDLLRAGLHILPYKFTSSTKPVLFDNAILMIEQRLVGLLDVDVQTAELEAMQVTRTSAGHYTMSAPSGMHDDCCVAVALMCWPLAHVSGSISASALEQLTGHAIGHEALHGRAPRSGGSVAGLGAGALFGGDRLLRRRF